MLATQSADLGTRGEPLVIQINIYGSSVYSSTRVKLTSILTANAVCEMIFEKNNVPHELAHFFTLIVVYSQTTSSGKKSYALRTLKGTDLLLDVLREKEAKTPVSKEALYTTKWYFKDIRTPPMEFDGDLSGDSSSEDEEDVPVTFLTYLSDTEDKGRMGYLLKRSIVDPNLWRKRLCLIADFDLWCIHTHNSKYRASRIKIEGPIYLQDDLLPLEYPLGFAIKSKDTNYFFRAANEEEQTAWISDLINHVSFEEDNVNISMADVIIEMEERSRNSRCSDTLQSTVSGTMLSWVAKEMIEGADEEEILKSGSTERWTLHNFHSDHPLCGKAIGFVVAVMQEYKEMFRKFIRPSTGVFWDCVIEIYRRYILPQIVAGKTAERSLCYPSQLLPFDVAVGKPVVFLEPTYLSFAQSSVANLLKMLSEAVRWKSKEEILEEISLKSGELFEQERAQVEAEAAANATGSYWFAGWVAGRGAAQESTKSNVAVAPAPQTRCHRKSSKYCSKRYDCMASPLKGDRQSSREIFVADYILLNGHDSPRPDINLFDDLVRDVILWLNGAEARHN